jgi:segregation and condensation protein A
VQRLKNFGMTSFLQLFKGTKTRSELVATFMAVLELCRSRSITLIGGTEDCMVKCEQDAPENFEL